MPYSSQWVDPGVLLIHSGVKVYYTYDNDDLEQGPRTYWFTLNPLCGEGFCDCPDPRSCRYVFDVREVPNWTEPSCPPLLVGKDNTPENKAAWEKYHEDCVEEKHIETVIRQAIEEGSLVAPHPLGEQTPPGPSTDLAEAVLAREADCLVLVAPGWFKRPDFIAWRSHAHVAKWIWADEGQDTFLVYDEGDLSDDGFLPKDIAQAIHQEAERAGMKYGTVWIKSV